MNNRSWKTSAAGFGVLLTTLGTTLNQLSDGNPATSPDWNIVLPLFFTGFIGLFASDHKRSKKGEPAPPDENGPA
jgi:hypothetical protein